MSTSSTPLKHAPEYGRDLRVEGAGTVLSERVSLLPKNHDGISEAWLHWTFVFDDVASHTRAGNMSAHHTEKTFGYQYTESLLLRHRFQKSLLRRYLNYVSDANDKDAVWCCVPLQTEET
ncbi:hypothetical protein BgiMline_034266 [Biomphalaria glabrata]|nr:hypothetical protein BgiMline_020448 [Biomphalaria glabrata]